MGILSRSVEARGERATTGESLLGDRERSWRSQRVAELSAGIAHEIRNPLNAMAIHLEVLSDKLRDEKGGLPAPVRPNLEAIRSQIHRLDGIIRQFSDFAQGRAPGNDVGPIVEGAVALCSFPLRRMGLDVEVSTLPRAAVADGAVLSLILVELLLLGVEVAEVGSRIGIEVRSENQTIQICLQSDTPNVRVEPGRLEMVDALLREQGGRLEAGTEAGMLAMLFIPEETAASSP